MSSASRLAGEALREYEPHVAGLAGLHVPSTGIIDYPAVCNALAEDVRAGGHDLRLGSRVTGLVEESGSVVVETSTGSLRARVLVNCAGLQSDRIAKLGDGVGTDVRIMPFRGEYYELKPERCDLVRNLIYPVPDPAFPFLGVHYTRKIGGGVEAGPNAVPALAREGYRWRTIDLADLAEIGRSRSTWVLARKYWKTQVGEFYRSASKRAFVAALQRLVPDVTSNDLVRAGAGVRAQAISPDGVLLDDFAFHETARQVHVLNAPSPAATASLPIGRLVASKAIERLA